MLTGKEIARYGENIDIEPWFLDEKQLTEEDIRRTKVEKVVVQDIVAHITKPVPYIKLTASLDTKKRFCLNTVMCFTENEKGLKNKFLVALLNSKLISFYFYFFVFNQAIRTMHFMPGYADYVPIPTNFREFQEDLDEKCTIMLENTSEIAELQNKFFTRMKSNYGLKKISENLLEFQKLDFTDFLNELKKGKALPSLKEQDELQDYFDEYKKKITELKNIFEKTNEEINHLVYRMYDLENKEIDIIEENIPI